MDIKKIIVPIIAVGIVIAAIVFLESKKSSPAGDTLFVDENGEVVSPGEIEVVVNTDRKEEKAKEFKVAKDISTPDAFINTEPISIKDLIGDKVVLVDFWTYSCINCQRTLPYLNAWHEKYADDGLVIIGVHTPEFEFEKKLENVQRAVDKWGINYPVVLDNDFSTWRAYENRYWPRKYLIDIDGFIAYDHIGEGAYEETEAKIVELLNERKQTLGEAMLAVDMTMPENVDEVDFEKVKSHETYLGSSRLQYLVADQAILNDCEIGSPCLFAVPETVPVGSFALEGMWDIQKEYSMLAEGSGKIVINFSASKVNLVAGADAPITARLVLDGTTIDPVTFGTEDLYNLVDLNGQYGEHVLEIIFDEPGVEAFAFTFG